MKLTGFFALALVPMAALGLSASPVPAQSLTLHSGDHITVDGTGTHGILNHRPVNNRITSYRSEGSKSYSYKGSRVTIDNDAVQVNGTATFTLGPGGKITGGPNGFALEVLDSGRVTIRGGTISSREDSPALGRTGSGTAIVAQGSATVSVSGGTITSGGYGRALEVEDAGAILVSGGTISGGQYGTVLSPEGKGTVTVLGGTFIGGMMGLSAGAVDGTINLFSQDGKPFLVNGIAANHTSLAENLSGTLSGTLPDGKALDIKFMNFGHINLNVGKMPAIAGKHAH